MMKPIASGYSNSRISPHKRWVNALLMINAIAVAFIILEACEVLFFSGQVDAKISALIAGISMTLSIGVIEYRLKQAFSNIAIVMSLLSGLATTVLMLNSPVLIITVVGSVTSAMIAIAVAALVLPLTIKLKQSLTQGTAKPQKQTPANKKQTIQTLADSDVYQAVIRKHS